MAVEVLRLRPGDGRLGLFFSVPARVYRSVAPWMALASRWQARAIVDGYHPLLARGDLAFFVALRDGECVGRVCTHVDPLHLARFGDATGLFGYLDTVEDPAVSRALLDAACAWLRERGMIRVRGPISLTMHEEVGLLVDGFDQEPCVGMPFHLPYQGGLVEAAGFAKARDLFSWRYVLGEVPPRARRAHESLVGHPDLKVRAVDPANLENDFATMLSLFDDARDDRWGWVRATRDDGLAMVRQWRPWLDPGLALIAEIDGRPAGVALGLPNVLEAMKGLHGRHTWLDRVRVAGRMRVRGVAGSRLMMLAVRPEIRAQRRWAALAAVLYVELNRRGREKGYTACELGWTYEDDAEVNVTIRMMGGRPVKRYRVYERGI